MLVQFFMGFRVWGVEFACLWLYEDDVYFGLKKVDMLLVACSSCESLQHQDMSGIKAKPEIVVVLVSIFFSIIPI